MSKQFELTGFSAARKRAAMAAVTLGLALLVGGMPARAQDQSSAPPAGDQQTPPPQPPLQADPRYGDPQQGAPPPQSDSTYGNPPRQGAPPPPYQDQGGPQNQGAPPPAGPRGRAPRAPMPAVPATLTLPAGTIIPVRMGQWLSSDKNHAGDSFNANLDQPLLANGWVVAQRGQPIIGQVAVAQKAGHGKSNSQLGLAITSLTLVSGQEVAVNTELVQTAAGGPTDGQRAGAVAATTILGAAIGAVAGGGTGAAIGAGVGAGAGVAGVMATPGRPTIVGPETLLSFRLTAPVDISTAGSEVAFRPFSSLQYGGDQDAYAQRGYAGGYPGGGPGGAGGPGGPAPYSQPYPYPAYYYGPCPYYGCYPYYYPYYGPYVGIGFGFGPRFYGRGPGFRRW